jgi:hypothetical protein
MPDSPQDFESTLAQVSSEITVLQAALRDALESVLPVSTGARACGRALGLTRFLGWAIWNLAYAPDVPAAIRSMPGGRGWASVIAALRKAGCPDPRLERLERSAGGVSRLFSRKRINVTLLRSIAAGGLDTERDASRMRKARRDGRAAAEILHGVRASLNLGITVFGSPDADGWIDFATASLFEGLERLRPGPAWPIYRRSFHRPAEGSAAARREPIEPGPLAPLVPSLSTPGAANGELRLVDDPVLQTIEFTAPRANRAGGLRASFAESTRRAIRLPADLATGDSALVLTVPARWAVYHLVLHRDLSRVGEPTAALYAPPDPMEVARRGLDGFDVVESNRLPLDANAETLEDLRLPARFRSCEPAYRALLDRAIRALGRTADEYVHFRVEVADPPLHGSVVLRWRLR